MSPRGKRQPWRSVWKDSFRIRSKQLTPFARLSRGTSLSLWLEGNIDRVLPYGFPTKHGTMLLSGEVNMGLSNLLRRRQTPAAVMPVPPAASAPREPELLTPEQRADLEAARAELRLAMDESQVTSFRACSRNGRHWAEDPDAMRAMAATFRSIKNFTAESATNGSDQT